MLAAHPPTLPPLTDAQREHSLRVAAALQDSIRAAEGWLPFDAFMQHALYAPGLGYYAAGSVKLDAGDARAPAGDFTTAPELTPLFGQTIARQVEEVLARSGTAHVLEFGAGSGALAVSVIDALAARGVSVRYDIVEVSADLRERQQQRLAAYEHVRWLDSLPAAFEGCVLANEVLDAMPVRIFSWNADGALCERGVALDEQGNFVWENRLARDDLADAVAARMPALPGYTSEVNLQAEAWVRHMGEWLTRGAALLIDYGFPQREYYHPQRAGGTLMCHLRHHAHADPFVALGLQDITAHVDFTAMADAALEGGMDVLGYTSQARFLSNAGLTELLLRMDPEAARDYAHSVAPVQKLLSEAEMGELFKVLAVGRGMTEPLIGFARGDRLGKL